MIKTVLLFLILLSSSLSYRVLITRKNNVRLNMNNNINSLKSKEHSIVKTASAVVSLSLSLLVSKAAIAGDTKAPSNAETVEAVNIIKQALEATKSMATLASEKKYNEISALFDTKAFTDFENACQILTRSDKLSADDRKALGTIKRYGVVADAIIMLGGIKGELKSGNVKITETGTSFQKAIEDDEDDDDDDTIDKPIKVNYPEIQRYIKLSYDSIADIYRISSQLK